MVDRNRADIAQRKVGIRIEREDGRSTSYRRRMRTTLRTTDLIPTAGNVNWFAEGGRDIRIGGDIGSIVSGARIAYCWRGVNTGSSYADVVNADPLVAADGVGGNDAHLDYGLIVTCCR